MAITGDHVRMVRGALRLTVREFAKMCGVDKMTVSTLERGARAQSGTQDKIREAFAPYVEFIEPVDGVRGAGIVMRWGVEPLGDASGSDAERAPGKTGSGLHSRAWDEDFGFEEADNGDMPEEDRASLRRYYEEHPDRWAKLSPIGKMVLARVLREKGTSSPTSGASR